MSRLELPEHELLRAKLHTARAELAAGRCTTHAVRTAFETWFSASCAAGRPPDALDQYIPDEAERFFSKLLQGSDGHVYWGGAQEFGTNDGRDIVPRRWWWFHLHGQPTERVQIKPFCGESNCIFPRHMRAIPWSELKQRYTDEQLIGAVQVVAMRLGRTPSCDEWDAGRYRPNRGTLETRFGSWNDAMRAAGLEPRPKGVVITQAGGISALDEEELLRAAAARIAELGHVPTSYEWYRGRYQPSYSTLKRHFGSWAAFIEAVGT